jgi:hypothetical protein
VSAQATAKELPFYSYLPDDMKLSLEIQVERDMSHDLRIKLRDALVKVQGWERESMHAASSQTHSPRSNPRHAAARARRRKAGAPLGRSTSASDARTKSKKKKRAA